MALDFGGTVVVDAIEQRVIKLMHDYGDKSIQGWFNLKLKAIETFVKTGGRLHEEEEQQQTLQNITFNVVQYKED